MPQEESVLRLGRDEALEAARLWQECGDAREFACRVLGGVMNALMDSEAQQMCGAGRNERSDGRENSRNGYRPRSLKTAVGDVELEIPKLRHGTYYPEGMLARWSRVDTSVAAIVQEMYVCGVSTRKVERVASKLGISSLSSSEVSSLCSDLDAEVAEFRSRDLSGTPCCYLWLDATYMSCRVGSSVVSQGVVTAIGLGADGRKHFLGCDVVDTESEDSFPRAHWAKLRTNNVQERANREIKRRYRVVQSFPSRESMLRLTCASLMETEGQWSQQRVFSEASAAEGFAEPADRPAPTEGRRRALGRRAGEIVDEIVEKRGLKKE